MIKTVAFAISLSLTALSAQAQPTRLLVRAQALDAKFIGDEMGGVAITLSDARTGAILATGLTRGATGDTNRIVRNPKVRWAGVTDATTAGFETTLDIDQPTLVRAEAVGPMGKPASAIRVSSTLLLIPGRDVVGDGWVLTFPGLVIEPTAEPAAAGFRVTATVRLMCGCPIEPGGLWDAANYSVEAFQMKGKRVVARAALTYAGRPSTFSGEFPKGDSGRYRLRIVATDAKSPNAGAVEQDLRLPLR